MAEEQAGEEAKPATMAEETEEEIKPVRSHVASLRKLLLGGANCLRF